MVLRGELEGTDIGVSVLCPGTVRTRINETSGEGQAKLLHQEIDPALVEANTAMLAQGADPNGVGEQVVEAMQQKQFLIVTHGDFLPLVDGIQNEIRTAFTEFDNRYGTDRAAEALLQGISPVTL